MTQNPTAVITGASSGIGAATARQLAAAGYDLVLGARRLEKLQEVAKPLGARALVLDVTDVQSVREFCAQIAHANVLVNNAGGALGLEPVAEAEDEKWQAMYDTNVLGLMRMTRALLPMLEASGSGHIVNITSIAAIEVYDRQGCHRDPAAGTAGQAGPCHRNRAGNGGDRVQRRALRGRPNTCG
jgi:NADP-dependent 3-hydroxy acid dehydrogenase YdfG